jgi:hypothetical protein
MPLFEMNELWLAFLLATSPTAPPCCHPPTFTLQADDATEVRDNIGHFVAPAILTSSFYGTALYLGAPRRHARWISVGTSLLLIVAKEAHDQSVAGRFGLEEVAIGLGGTAAGLWFAERVDWSDELYRSKPPR